MLRESGLRESVFERVIGRSDDKDQLTDPEYTTEPIPKGWLVE